MRNLQRLLLVVAALCALPSCVSNSIDAAAIAEPVHLVTQRHDQMLDGTLDPSTISDDDKATFKRTSRLLNAVVDEAMSGGTPDGE